MANPSNSRPDPEAFLNAFATDIFLLHYARSALLSHPTLPPVGFDIETGICRLFIARAVDVIEDGLLQLWRDLPPFDEYFSEKNKRNPRERIESLIGRFHSVGIEVNPADIADFLALRYLRNIVEHGRLKPHEDEYLRQRQMPTDPTHFDIALRERALQIAQNLARHIAQAGLSVLGASAWDRLASMNDAWLSLTLSTNAQVLVPHLLRREETPLAFLASLSASLF